MRETYHLYLLALLLAGCGQLHRFHAFSANGSTVAKTFSTDPSPNRPDPHTKKPGTTTYPLVGTLIYSMPCDAVYMPPPGDCLMIYSAGGGLYYLTGPGPSRDSITFNPVFDRSVVDELGYPLVRYVIKDAVTGVTMPPVEDGETVHLQVEIDNPLGMGYGGTITRIDHFGS